MTGRRPRTPGIAYAVLALVLLVVVATLALTQRQQPPPTIAEFAPQAVENITDAPTDQSASTGAGTGDCAAGQACGAEPGVGNGATPAAPVDVPRVRRCVGDPPRQIEDPQSPPCVPYWSGDNGGATYRGVTRDEIRLAVPLQRDPPPGQTYRDLEAFFNKRFEFYGRKLKFIGFNSGGNGNPSQEQLQAEAAMVDEQIGAFASLSLFDQGAGAQYYHDELARRRILSVMGSHDVYVGEDHFARRHPYEWDYLQGFDLVSDNLSGWICAQVAGGTADHAGGTEQSKPRVFGLAVTDGTNGPPPDISRLQYRLRGCGAAPVVTVESQGDAGSAQNAVLQMRSAGVTSVICLCHVTPWLLYYTPSAKRTGYSPEWLISNWISNDYEQNPQALSADKDQLSHAFGVFMRNKWLPPVDTPVAWAVREVNPGRVYPDLGVQQDTFYIYGHLLLFASGTQMAGPSLTPGTFAEGLRKARWPNPDCGRPPYHQACVDFSSGRHTMNTGATVVWYGVNEPSTWSGVGAWCYGEHGARYLADQWPRHPPTVFSGSCQ